VGGKEEEALYLGAAGPKNWKEKERKAENIGKGKCREGVRGQKTEGGGYTKEVEKAVPLTPRHRKARSHLYR